MRRNLSWNASDTKAHPETNPGLAFAVAPYRGALTLENELIALLGYDAAVAIIRPIYADSPVEELARRRLLIEVNKAEQEGECTCTPNSTCHICASHGGDSELPY